MSKRAAGEEDAETGSSIPKVADPNPAADSNLPGLEIVLGASGAETTAHAGFLKAIEDNDVPVGRITGVSGGSLVAALYANKYSPSQIKDILLSDDFRYPKLDVLAKCFHVMDPWNLYPYAMDFRPWLKDFVDTYHLKPQPNLRIVAADSETKAPIVFEGTNYDLTTALSASTAATPALGLKPVEVNGRTAIDGFYYHPIPAALSKAPALVSKIGFVSKLPTEALTPWDYFLHVKEMAYYKELKDKYPDPPGNIIATTGLSDVATTTFGISKETMEKLVQHGYDATTERLQQPDAVAAIEEARKEVAAAQKSK
jgi:predicted acylesterase/phospholipase RssA